MTRQTPLTIILTGGGSGGHIVPLLSVAQELKRLDPACRLVYVGLRGDKVVGLDQQLQVFDQIERVASGKFRRYHGRSIFNRLIDLKTLALNLADVFKVIIGIVQAYAIMRRLRPAVVFSKGGYVVVPVGVAARLRKLPIVTHDSDAVPGLANRLIGRWAKVRTSGQAPGAGQAGTIRHIGVPVPKLAKIGSRQLSEAKARLGLGANDQVLLVGGGGLGSKAINQLTEAVAKQLLIDFPSLSIYHLTGHQHEVTVTKTYDKLLAADLRRRVSVAGFSHQFNNLTAAADLVVSRAGATTLAELAAQAKASIIIPSPWLAGGHQTANAQRLIEHQAALVLPNDVSAKDYYWAIAGLLKSRADRQRLANNLHGLARPTAAVELAKIIIEQASGPNKP